ncbi:MAG: hypothetical protein J0H08_02780 [Rhizobiales bacterium]|nr:hypothetical protein [Hyphomicrobiales bacterium]
MNAIRPDLMSPAERLAEIVEILAAGAVRLRARQSSPLLPPPRESSLDCADDQSGHAKSETEKGR